MLGRVEFHFTPRHAGWFNKVEIKIAALQGQCLNRRMPDWKSLEAEMAAWEKQGNEDN
ncbi:MAG: hypothetical protein OXB95_05070 [Rhodobacteraceae bacterium]|nr:hypothetical protein [Paracoccaceae bacterium]